MTVPTWKILMMAGLVLFAVAAHWALAEPTDRYSSSLLGAVLLTALLGGGIIGAVVWWARRPLPAGIDPRSMDAWRLRFGRVFRWLVPATIGLGIILGMVKLTSKPSPAERGTVSDPRLCRSNGAITSKPLGLVLPVSDTWQWLDAQPGVDVMLQSPETGAVFAGTALISEPRDEALAATLERIVEGRRKRWGAVTVVERSQEKLGGVAAEAVRFTLPSAPKGATRVHIWLAKRGRYTVSFHCSGLEGQYGRVFGACSELLSGLRLGDADG